MQLPKQYDFKESEKKWQKFWDKNKTYKFNPKSKKPVYSIDTPPPYASAGHLHVGHALSYTQFEIIARIMRLLGYNVYFPPGYDDNGLPTEKYVEEKLGINKAKTNRAEFRKLCLEESKKVEKVYTENVFKKLGHSYDWDLLYQTISPESQRVAQTAFLKLVKKGDCYKAKEPTIWCPYHETALAQAEVENLTRTTKLNYIKFGNDLLIATTRPEFLSSCVGIFVHPEDKRYKKLIGKEIEVPLFNHKVKVMADETVDPEFGTGIMMVCTFGDNADIEKWKKYNLDLRISVDREGKLNELGGKYKGMKLEKAREEILKDLEEKELLEKQEELQQIVGSCWRCNTPVEYIVTDQWLIKTLKYKKELLKRGKEVDWHPKFMRVRYEDWVKNLGWDWTISRQRYFGIPIPVWYCDKCHEVILPEENELPIDPIQVKKKCKCGGKGVPDEDVFDTWMTSSNSPEIALRWLEKPEQYKKLAPMSLRPQSHDIIRTWAFYTILKSHLLFKRIPWKDLIINTFVLDSKGHGMSKSKGNAIWADDLIDKYGVDVFRYWVGGANLGSDLPFNEKELIAGQKLLTKMWNASKFVIMNLEDFDRKKPKLEPIDEYTLLKLEKTVKNIKENYIKYNISMARKLSEEFFWHTFCDNYLEIVKDRLYNPDKRGKEKRKSAQYTLYHSLLTILKLFAPIMPHITEEIYHLYFDKKEKEKSIHISEWPKEMKITKNKLEKLGDEFIDVISKVRKFKNENNKSLKEPVKLTVDKKLSIFLDDLKAVTNASEIRFGNEFIKS